VHKHSYNAVGVIFGAATQKLLYIWVRNKYSSVCAIHKRKQSPVPEHGCFKNWNGSSCAEIIVAGFRVLESAWHEIPVVDFRL